jgi:hypothetical protein
MIGDQRFVLAGLLSLFDIGNQLRRQAYGWPVFVGLPATRRVEKDQALFDIDLGEFEVEDSAGPCGCAQHERHQHRHMPLA